MGNNNLNLFLTLCVAAFGLGGCPDSVVAQGDTTVTTDVAGSDTVGEADTPPDASGPDIPLVDPCDPNPCQNGGSCANNDGAAVCNCVDSWQGDNCENAPPDPCADFTCPGRNPECSDASTYITYDAGTCANDNNTARCTYEVANETVCAATEVCTTSSGCVTPVDPGDYSYSGTSSFIHHMVIGGIDATVPECGFDLDSGQANGDPDKDNELGALAGGLGSILGDIDLKTILDDQIAEGSLVILLEWVGYDGNDDNELTVNGFYGDPVDSPAWDFATAEAGNGEFTVDPESFDIASGLSLISFPGATTGDQLLAGPSDFSLIIPLGDISLAVTVSDTQLAGTVADHANGVSITDGELGGGVKIEELVAAINAYIETSCSCLGMDGAQLIDYVDDLTKPSCNQPNPDNNTCGSAEDTCEMITQFCSAIFLVLAGDLDTNANGETKYDALSVGVCLEATGATIQGLTAP